MLCREVYFVPAVVLAVLIVRVTAEEPLRLPSGQSISKLFDPSKIKDHYPLAWVEVPYKPIVDNDRLFKKYKECVVAVKPIGCPKIITEIMKIVPEVIETNCGKCLPAHIKRIKEAAEYICRTRREDVEEVRRLKDPDRAIQDAFEKKFGKVNC